MGRLGVEGGFRGWYSVLGMGGFFGGYFYRFRSLGLGFYELSILRLSFWVVLCMYFRGLG